MFGGLVRFVAALGLVAMFAAAPALADSGKIELIASARSAAIGGLADPQWQLQMLDAPRAWKVSTGAGVTVAVIDSGVYGGHPDLQGRVLPGLDLVTPGGDGSNDEVGHGTTVAGLIAGTDINGRGAAGIAPDATILPVRVLDRDNKYDDAKVVAEGIVWAVDHGAKVINLSLGGGVASAILAEAIDYAFARDVVVVACVGNVLVNGPTSTWHPASEAGVVAVTALNENGSLWAGSLQGPATVLAAPGNVLMGAKPGGYQYVQGTSFAAPLVAGVAALIRSEYPQMSAANVVQRLIKTARDEGAPGRDDRFGFGVVDPYAALTDNVPQVMVNPLDNTPPPGKSGFGRAPLESIPGITPSAAPSLVKETLPVREAPPMSVAAALAGFAVLVGGGITLMRRL